MKPQHARRRTGGFTGWDLLICVVTVALLVGVLLPFLAKSKFRTNQLGCTSRLKQIGLAFRMWSNDHGDKFPMQSSMHSTNGGSMEFNLTGEALRTWSNDNGDKFPKLSYMHSTNGGTMEFNLTGEVWRHFKILSSELNSPSILVCSRDTTRQRAANFDEFTSNKYLSYFVGLDADETKPQTILSGDRNLTSPTVKPVKGVLNLTASDRLEWTKAIHNEQGNLGLGDGSVQQITTASLNKQLQSAFLTTTQAVHRLALPE